MLNFIIVLCCIALFAYILFNLRFVHGSKVVVPKGQFHIVKYASECCVLKLPGESYQNDGVKVIVLEGTPERFTVKSDDCFVFPSDPIDADIKLDAEGVYMISDLQVIRYDPLFVSKLIIHISLVAHTACMRVSLRDLLENGIPEVIADDAIAAQRKAIQELGVEMIEFHLSNFRDAFGKETVADMQKELAKKVDDYSDLEKNDSYSLALNG